MTTRETLRRGWAVLSAPTDHRAYTSFPLELQPDRVSCRLAVDRSGVRHVLVPVEQIETLQSQRGSALAVEQHQLIFGGEQRSYVDVSCIRSDLYYEFDGVVQDIVDAVQDAADARRATLEVVGRWRRLFRAAASRGMAGEARLGLWAELVCLREFLTVDPTLSIETWRGPFREPHDFELPSACVEVKASGTASDAVRVHGVEQLELHDGKALYLVVLTVAEAPEGRTMQELVTDVVDVARDSSGIAERLVAAGWSNDDPAADMRYALGAVAVVPVSADTPRIVSSSFARGESPAGVNRVDYSIERLALIPHMSTASINDMAAAALK